MGPRVPSRMALKQGLKYMNLEGDEELLYDLNTDPLELKNRIDDLHYQDQISELRKFAHTSWDPERAALGKSSRTKRNGSVFTALRDGSPSYVYALSDDDRHKYVRNAGGC